jgi:diguanylate cyclase (GGDEF)-like protein/PAS domain S-box-containing protein
VVQEADALPKTAPPEHAGIARLLAVIDALWDGSRPLEQSLAAVAEQVVAGVRFPDRAGVRLRVGEHIAETPGFRSKSDVLLSEAISFTGIDDDRDGARGSIDLGYSGSPPAQGGEPFTTDERTLLRIVARLLAIAFAPSVLAHRSGPGDDAAGTLTRIVQESPVVAFVWDLTEGWPVAFVADSVKQFGYDAAEFFDGRVQYADIVHPDDQPRVGAEVKANLMAGLPEYVQFYRIRTKDGHFRWVYDWTRVLRDDSGQAKQAQGLLLDITDRVVAEEHASRYLAVAGNLFLVLDLSGKVVAVNAKTCEIIGDTADNLIGSHWVRDFVAAEDRADVEALLSGIVAEYPSRAVGTSETMMVSRDGERHMINWQVVCDPAPNGTVDQLIAFGTDVTEQWQTKTRLQDLTDNLPGAVFQYVLNPDGTDSIDYMSPGSETIWELAPTRFEQDPSLAWAMIDPEDRPGMRASVEASARNLTPWHHRWRIQTPSGKRKWLQGSGSPRRTPSGGTLWNTLILDVTEQEELHQRIEKIAAHVPGIIYQYQQWPDGRAAFPFASQGIRTIYGVEPEEVAEDATEVFKVLHPDDLERIQASIARSMERLETWHDRYRVRFADGRTTWVEGQSSPEPQPDGSVIWHGYIHDITERKQAEAQVQLAASVFANGRDGILITDPGNRILRVNPSFTRITGYAEAEILGRDPKLLASGRHDRTFYEAMWHAINTQGFWQGEIWNRRRNGEMYPEMLSISVVRDSNGDISNYIAVFADISQAKAHEAELDRIAHHDHLTGVPNRRLLTDRLTQAVERSRRSGLALAVCYLDLDGFKDFNDRHGHDSGDRLLINIAQALQGVLRGEDTLARLGGDEFVLLLADLHEPSDCVDLLNRIRAVIRQPVAIDDAIAQVTVSIGVTLCPPDAPDPDTLLRHADQAMYLAKESGKNTYHLYDAEQDRLMQARRVQREHLRRALERGELRLHFQPQVDLITREVVRVEGLIRWQHPERGLLPPGAFLPDIEGSTLEVAVGEWVIATALEQHQAWLQEGLRVPISINIGAKHLLRQDFAAKLREQLAAHPEVDPSQLELEILETAALSNIEQATQVVSECKAMGLRIAMDDFGTGYSSLAYLRRLPGDVLKIDMEFVRDMLIDPNDLEIVEIVIRLSHTFGRTVVAEGVETLQHAALLAWLGCHQAQGYGIARPLAADQVLGWISRWSAHREWEELDPDEQTARRYPEMELLGAVQNHRHWMYRVEQALAGASPDELKQIAEGDCPFGRWYDGPGRERFGHLEEFLAVGERHAELHRVVADCSSRGSVEGGSASTATLRRRVEDASRMLRGELRRLVQRIQADAPGAQDAPR